MAFDMTGARTGGDLEKRISRLEDIESIRNLWAEYAYLSDTSTDGWKVADLHAEDAVWEGFGNAPFAGQRHEGRQAIGEFISGFYDGNPWRDHHMTNFVVDVDDDGVNATGRSCLFDLVTVDALDGEGYEAAILTGDYDLRFRKVDGVWKVSYVRLEVHQFSALDKGWVTQPTR